MGEIVNRVSGGPADSDDSLALENRLFRGMKWTVAVAVLVCAPLAPWKVTTGVLLGGLLSLLNFHWLRSSISAIFSNTGARPRLNVASFVLRYLAIGLGVFAGYFLNLVSLPATFAGLCSIVVPFMLEAGRNFYQAIFNRED
jgi:hypothetical protein